MKSITSKSDINSDLSSQPYECYHIISACFVLHKFLLKGISKDWALQQLMTEGDKIVPQEDTLTLARH